MILLSKVGADLDPLSLDPSSLRLMGDVHRALRAFVNDELNELQFALRWGTNS